MVSYVFRMQTHRLLRFLLQRGLIPQLPESFVYRKDVINDQQ